MAATTTVDGTTKIDLAIHETETRAVRPPFQTWLGPRYWSATAIRPWCLSHRGHKEASHLVGALRHDRGREALKKNAVA